jgi:hypothetical protein
MYNFKARVELHRTQMSPVRRGGFKLASPKIVSSGTLADCVTKVMEKSDPDRRGYSITVGPDSNIGKTVLGLEEIEALYQHVNFPRS